MAVDLVASDLIHPTGELQESMFPDEDLETNVIAWLTQTEAQLSGSNLVAKHWVYYRGYDAVANRLTNTPATINIDSTVTRTISSSQIKYYQDKATAHLSEYNRLTSGDLFVQLKPVKFSVY